MKKYRLALSKLELLRVHTTQQRSWFHLGFCKSSRGPVNKLSERVMRYRCACYSQYVRVLRFFSTHCMFSWMTSKACWTQRSRKVASDWFSKNAWTCKLHTEVFQKKRKTYLSFEYPFQISFKLVMVMLMWSCFKKEFPLLPQGWSFQISSGGWAGVGGWELKWEGWNGQVTVNKVESKVRPGA